MHRKNSNSGQQLELAEQVERHISASIQVVFLYIYAFDCGKYEVIGCMIFA